MGLYIVFLDWIVHVGALFFFLSFKKYLFMNSKNNFYKWLSPKKYYYYWGPLIKVIILLFHLATREVIVVFFVVGVEDEVLMVMTMMTVVGIKKYSCLIVSHYRHFFIQELLLYLSSKDSISIVDVTIINDITHLSTFSTFLFHFVQTIVFKSNTLIEYKNVLDELLSPFFIDSTHWQW